MSERYIGVSSSQDGRFSDKEEKYKKETKFAKIFEQKVDMKKVNINYSREWVDKKSMKHINSFFFFFF